MILNALSSRLTAGFGSGDVAQQALAGQDLTGDRGPDAYVEEIKAPAPLAAIPESGGVSSFHFALPALAGLLWSGMAVAAPHRNIPDFSPEQHVYCVPANECPYSTEALERALQQATYPAYVLVYTRVGGETQDDALRNITDTVDAAQDKWIKDRRFAAGYTTIIGHTVNERAYYSLPGAHFAEKHSFERGAVKAVERAHFVPKAKSGDLQGAMVDLVVALDKKYIEFEKSEIMPLLETAQNLLASTELSTKEKAQLQALYDQAQKFSSGNLDQVPVSVLLELPPNLKKQIDDLVPLQKERQKIRADYEKILDALRALPKHAELQEADAADIEYASRILARSAAIGAGLDFDGMAAATRSIQADARLKALLSSLDERTKLRSALKQTLQQSQSDVSIIQDKSDAGQIGTEQALVLAYNSAVQLKSSPDMASVHHATQKLISAQKDYDALKEARRQTQELIDKIRVTLTNEADLLVEDSLVEYQQVADQAQTDLNNADSQKLEQAVLPALTAANKKLEELVSKRALERGTRQTFTFGSILALLAMAGAAGVRKYRFNMARDAFNHLAQEWLDKIDRHSKQLGNAVMGGEEEINAVISEFSEMIKGELIRDGALNQSIRDFLASKTGDTLAAFTEFESLLQSGHDGLTRLRLHVEKNKALAAKAGFIKQEPLRQATERLAVLEDDDTNIFDLSLDENPEGDAPKRTSIADFWRILTANYNQMRVQWLRLLDAIRAANRKAEMDLPAEEYEMLRLGCLSAVTAFLGQGTGGQSGRNPEQEHEASDNSDEEIIINNVFAKHPFLDKAGLWQRVNDVRSVDPIASMRMVDEVRKSEAQVKREVNQIEASLRAAGALFERVQSITIDYSSTQLHDDADPRLAEVGAREARQDLLATMRNQTAAEIIKKIQVWHEKLAAVHTQKQAVVAAMAKADAGVDEAARKLAETQTLIFGAQGRDREMSQFHDEASMADARASRMSAEDSLRLLDQAQAEARVLLQQRNHVEALKRARVAVTHADAAASSIKIFYERLQSLAAVRSAYENLYDALVQSSEHPAGKRHAYVAKLNELRDFGSEELLAEGDAYLKNRQRDPRQGAPVNWATCLADLQNVEKLWQRGVDKAQNRSDVAASVKLAEDLQKHFDDKVKSAVDNEKNYHDSSSRGSLDRSVGAMEETLARLTANAAEAQRLLRREIDIDAGTKARECIQQKESIQRSFQGILVEVAKLKTLRDAYRSEYASAKSTRSSCASDVRRNEGSESRDLADGDRIFNGLAAPDSQGVNYASLRSSIDRAERKWKSGVEDARRRKAAEDAEEAAKKARLAADSHSHFPGGGGGGGGTYGDDSGRGGGGTY